jgi:hypothetical protein
MKRTLMLVAALSIVGCAHTRSDDCYTESGWLDATNGCTAREGYPDCYVVCPNAGTRKKVQSSPTPPPDTVAPTER